MARPSRGCVMLVKMVEGCWYTAIRSKPSAIASGGNLVVIKTASILILSRLFLLPLQSRRRRHPLNGAIHPGVPITQVLLRVVELTTHATSATSSRHLDPRSRQSSPNPVAQITL
ncbi:hypothetical protein HK405_009549, partial [Cladochytrium tenue]